jgi:hypothetical protein
MKNGRDGGDEESPRAGVKDEWMDGRGQG